MVSCFSRRTCCSAALLTIAFALYCGLVSAAETPIELSDIKGGSHRPLAVGKKKGVVLIFVSPFCPTSNTFGPEANNIARDYADRFAFYLVEADADIKLADAKRHGEMLEAKVPVLLDPKQLLAKRTKARITPEAVVLGANGETLYQGRINDLYTTPTKKLKEPKTHDLRVALDAISAGQPVAVFHTKAIGCSITLVP